jgi:cob(I)alamin adenosyltransferase
MTGLGTGQRISKADPRVDAYGAVDELNAAIGAALAAGVDQALQGPLERVQTELFCAGAELCIPDLDQARCGPHIETPQVAELERIIDQLDEKLPPLRNFILPGGAAAAAQLHVARTICRRAERAVVALAEQQPVAPALREYLNRLSDALFVMGRYQNQAAGVVERIWSGRR